MKHLLAAACALALMLASAQHVRARDGGAFAGTMTGTIKPTDRHVACGYGFSRWGIRRPARCNKRTHPHCHTH